MVKIITPYVNEQEIQAHMDEFWDLEVYYEQDTALIGPDLMFETMWNRFPEEDIFILHSDMSTFTEGWFQDVMYYVDKYPEAGMFGCLLLYPAQDEKGDYFIQSAGGKFTNGRPDHFGSGITLENKSTFKDQLETDTGEYDKVREVAWTTFGGCYLRRSFINAVGGFNTNYEWSYNRDVEFCLDAREKGQKIYQIPVKLFHHESRDTKRLRQQNPAIVQMEHRNLEKLKNKWGNTDFYKTLDKEV